MMGVRLRRFVLGVWVIFEQDNCEYADNNVIYDLHETYQSLDWININLYLQLLLISQLGLCLIN